MPCLSIPARLPGSNSSWTPERIEALTRLWNDGEAASVIAAKLGEVTRNAVIGKVHRLGLAGRATTSRQPRPRRTSPRRTGGRSGMRKPVLRSRPCPATPDRLPPAPAALMLSVAQLTAATCHWPIGDPRAPGFGFCGARATPGDKQPYCATHQRFGHQPRRARA
jgi:GcrA cell cycle regulator